MRPRPPPTSPCLFIVLESWLQLLMSQQLCRCLVIGRAPKPPALQWSLCPWSLAPITPRTFQSRGLRYRAQCLLFGAFICAPLHNLRTNNISARTHAASTQPHFWQPYQGHQGHQGRGVCPQSGAASFQRAGRHRYHQEQNVLRSRSPPPRRPRADPHTVLSAMPSGHPRRPLSAMRHRPCSCRACVVGWKADRLGGGPLS